jgi:long-chain acyl-CoA synthetase
MANALGFLDADAGDVKLIANGELMRAHPAILAAAHAIRRAGVSSHDRVALVPSERPRLDTMYGYLGALVIGATPVLLRPRDPQTTRDFEALGVAAISSGSSVKGLPEPVRGDRDESLIVFTSGSTSKPKGVRFSGAGVRHNLDATQSYLGLDSADIVALPLPIYYVYGLSMLNLAIRVGATIVVCDYTMPPIRWLCDIEAANCTVLVLLPHQVRLLLRSSVFSRAGLPKVEKITIAGGPLDDLSIRELSVRFPTALVYLMYGQTEAGPRISYLPPDDLLVRVGSIGFGIPGWTEMRLASAGDTGTDAHIGEIFVRSGSLMLGYLDEVDPSPITVDGWLATGDIGRRDSDGYYFVMARASPFFKPFGERVPFAELLDVISRLEPDGEVRLEPLADPILGETVRLHVTVSDARPESAAGDLKHRLQRELGSTRTPREIVMHMRGNRAKLT